MTPSSARIYSLCANFFAHPRSPDARPDPSRKPDHGNPLPAPPRLRGGRARRAAGRAQPLERPEAARHHDRARHARARVRRPAVRLLPRRAKVEQASRSALKQIIKTFFDNSPGSAMAALLDMSSDSISDDEYKRLSALLKRRTQGRRSMSTLLQNPAWAALVALLVKATALVCRGRDGPVPAAAPRVGRHEARCVGADGRGTAAPAAAGADRPAVAGADRRAGEPVGRAAGAAHAIDACACDCCDIIARRRRLDANGGGAERRDRSGGGDQLAGHRARRIRRGRPAARGPAGRGSPGRAAPRASV